MTIQDYVAIATSVFTLAGVIFVGWQVRQMAESILLSRVQNQHLLCFEVWKQYNDVFADRQQLLQDPIRLAALRERCPTIDDVVNSDEYLRLKRAAGVYVLAGALIEAGAISPSEIFKYISVPRRMWNDHLPLIQYLRLNYYPDLWVHWERLVALPENQWTVTGLQTLDKH